MVDDVLSTTSPPSRDDDVTRDAKETLVVPANVNETSGVSVVSQLLLDQDSDVRNMYTMLCCL